MPLFLKFIIFLTFIHTIQSHSVHPSPFAEARYLFCQQSEYQDVSQNPLQKDVFLKIAKWRKNIVNLNSEEYIAPYLLDVWGSVKNYNFLRQ